MRAASVVLIRFLIWVDNSCKYKFFLLPAGVKIIINVVVLFLEWL